MLTSVFMFTHISGGIYWKRNHNLLGIEGKVIIPYINFFRNTAKAISAALNKMWIWRSLGLFWASTAAVKSKATLTYSWNTQLSINLMPKTKFWISNCFINYFFITLQCPDQSCKQDLLAYLEQIKLYSHQLKICSQVKAEIQNLGGELIMSAVSKKWYKSHC